ncbi:AAA family ATPase [Actinoplanes sp. CA-054009]
MLRSFQVGNHRSLKVEQELLLMPAYTGPGPVVPVAAAFGSNASGKSNLLDSLRWMQNAVTHSYRSWEPESGVPRAPFKLDPDAGRQPSGYAVDLIVDGVQFVYGFSVTDEAVVEEWLHTYPRGRERVIFEREGQSVKLGSTLPERRGRADALKSLLRENALLLSTAVQANQEEVLPVYRWFRDGLRLLDSRRSWARTAGVMTDRFLEAMRRYPEFVELIKVADVGISGVEAVPAQAELVRADAMARLLPDGDPARLLNDRSQEGTLQQEVSFVHGDGDARLGLQDQSDGTLAWADLVIAALSAVEAGAVLAIDEIDASLHPRLTARLIELFRSTEVNPLGAQLIFTSHDATLLGTSLGGEILHRDEVWFVEKQDNASRLYPLSDFHPRKGENWERRYLAGSYGAVPVTFTGSAVESVLAAREDRPDAAA